MGGFHQQHKIRDNEPLTPSGLRWTMLDDVQGGVLTWSYNHANCPLANTEAEVVAILQQIFDRTQDYVNIIFQKKSNITDSNVDIVWMDETIDPNLAGPTLALVYQPSVGNNMAVCSPICGDVRNDSDENLTLAQWQRVIMHEVFHSISSSHLSNSQALMFPTYFGQTGLQITLDDRHEIYVKYPY